ncbi:P22AR C-terminal domain-containing protein [Avibacterium paragallinarum]|uniref:P22AR C-terminal domain-containing protein n=1 Tax=Avibacterium paragallinarum TaxID=728 RepID=UPI00021AD301|nr:P22AR C-terminal domain-containing protein [Avibacterium paragallinarum]AZI13599.1 bacteriocin [Avibacterium paragallinarum]QIR12086.1 bacteriocin [Avibacterium paragallinarum]QJE09094.1 bacteriocin [Avibacterium paragallinarum]QJE11290.1 bacteriocin [Avibacterium paragallinarum]QJE13487.1 bacteriocin [Avibacterium paragallinarum]
MSNLQILNNSIRTLDNLYSLNDLHLASGNDPKHRPSLFVRNEQTKELVKEIESENTRSTKTIFALKTIRGGKDISVQGTWACEELVLSYAMWISPKFHLVVLRAFLAMHKGEVKQQQLALPEPEKKYTFEFTEYELEQLAWLWFSHKRMNTLLADLYEPLNALGSTFSGTVYSHAHEYRHHYEHTQATMQRLIEPFKHSTKLNWQRVIPRISPTQKQLGF